VPPAKIDLGVAGYGYAWRPHSNDMLSDAQARALIKRYHARAHWSKSVGEWTARLKDGSVLWWSDARSLTARAQLAAADHLGGLAVWSLGLSDPI
jgi:spore germination protein YaaH